MTGDSNDFFNDIIMKFSNKKTPAVYKQLFVEKTK